MQRKKGERDSSFLAALFAGHEGKEREKEPKEKKRREKDENRCANSGRNVGGPSKEEEAFAPMHQFLSLSPRSSTPKLSQNAGTDLSPSFLSVLISFDVIEREYRPLLRTVSPLDGNSTQPLVLLLRA